MNVPIIRKSHLWKLHGGSDSRGYPYASGFGPLPDGMPFYSPMEIQRNLEFWKVNPQPPGMEVERGSRWPDFMEHGGGSPWFFVSERVVASLQQMGAPIHRLTEMPIATIASKTLRSKTPPRYFVVETVPGIEVDLEASGFELDEFRKPKQRPFSTSPPPLKYRRNSWNGSDLFDFHLFRDREVRHVNMLCSTKLKELAEQEKWTNVSFTNLALT